MATIETFAQCEKRFFARLLERGFEPEVVFDIGAANACWSLMMSEVWPNAQYELFEPLAQRNPEYREILAERLRSNPNFRMHEFALSDHEGQSEFWNAPNPVGSSLLAQCMPKAERIVVPVRRLDDVVAQLGLPQPQVIKMDVQGGEALVLRGGARTLAKAEVLHLETWLKRGYGRLTPLLPELMEGLRPFGFVLVHLGGFYRDPAQELTSVDAFFAHQRLIERLRDEDGGYPWPEHWEG